MTESRLFAGRPVGALSPEAAGPWGRRRGAGRPAPRAAVGEWPRAPLSRRSRRDERGAALLIVAVVLSMLAVVGAYAAASTAKVHRAAGHARIAARTRALSEHGMRVMAAHAPGVLLRDVKLTSTELATAGGAADTCPATSYQKALWPEQEQQTWHCVRRDVARLAAQFGGVSLVTPASELLDQREHGMTMYATNPIAWTASPGEEIEKGSQRVTVFVDARYGGAPGAGAQSCDGQFQTSLRHGAGTLVLRDAE